MFDKKYVVPAAIVVILAGAVIASETGFFDATEPGVDPAVEQEAIQEAAPGPSAEEIAAAQLRQDAAACEMWGYEQVGIPVDADDPTREEYSVVKSTAIGTAAGAGVGAVGGEVTADKAGKGAVIGAIVGGAAGYLKSRSDKKEYEAEVAEQEAQLEALGKAVDTCMTARGY